MVKKQSKIKIVTFGLAGIITGAVFNIMGAENDIFTEIYPGMDFPFYQVLPSYLNIPITILFTQYLKTLNTSLEKKIRYCVLAVVVSFLMVPILALSIKDPKSSKVFKKGKF